MSLYKPQGASPGTGPDDSPINLYRGQELGCFQGNSPNKQA